MVFKYNTISTIDYFSEPYKIRHMLPSFINEATPLIQGPWSKALSTVYSASRDEPPAHAASLRIFKVQQEAEY